MKNLALSSSTTLRSFSEFVSEGCGIQLYDYQLQPAAAILDSIRFKQGLTIVLVFPGMSGKDELLAQLEAYLMRMLNDLKMRIVVVNCSDANTKTAVMRLGDRLNSNVFTSYYWKMDGMDFVLGEGWTIFYSMEALNVGEPTQANLLLIVNEAQNITPGAFDQLNESLTSGSKITRVICGSGYGGQNLLKRAKERAIQDEQKDGIRRLFEVTEVQARKENKSLDFTMDNIDELYGGSRAKELKNMFLGD